MGRMMTVCGLILEISDRSLYPVKPEFNWFVILERVGRGIINGLFLRRRAVFVDGMKFGESIFCACI